MRKDYQEDGFVTGHNQKALAEANRQLNAAKRVIPDSQRDNYKSGIRYLKEHNGYSWYIVLK